MRAEVSLLLESVPGEVVSAAYRDAVLIENCLGKQAAATRAVSFQRLKELYALDERVSLFRVLRRLWGENRLPKTRQRTSRPGCSTGVARPSVIGSATGSSMSTASCSITGPSSDTCGADANVSVSTRL